MRIALLGDAQSVHTVKWANGLAECGLEVHLITIHPLKQELLPAVKLHALSVKAPFGYLLSLGQLKRLLARIKPDILNAHFASGYGLLARLSKFQPLMISVWGSDIYKFPHKSRFHHWLIKGNLDAARGIGSTSNCMAEAVSAIAPDATIYITPFGINESFFQPDQRPSERNTLVVGTVKSLQSIYGVDVLLKAFAEAARSLDDLNIAVRLEITGDGPDRSELEELCRTLEIDDRVIFHGAVPFSDVPKMLNRLDVYVALSREESFGVAILEAAACRLPVVVSDAPGLAEITEDGINGFVVPRNCPEAASAAIVKLCSDPGLRQQFGDAGRLLVLQNYTWSKSLQSMMEAYSKVMMNTRTHTPTVQG